MKIICIDDDVVTEISLNLTYGKIYEILNEDEDFYAILDDLGSLNEFYKWRFSSLEEWRELRIDKILE